jgi:hypothetical protein
VPFTSSPATSTKSARHRERASPGHPPGADPR